MNQIDLANAPSVPSIIQEEFRSLYSNIQFSGEQNRVICITSTFPNEGKSYVSFNLARIMAEGNKKVVFIDCDLRNSVLYQDIGMEKEAIGLSNVLHHECEVKQALYSTTDKGFYLMPTGGFPDNPTTLLRSKIFGDVIRALEQVFDYILIDTPPVGLVTDGTIIANVCDASLLVVDAGAENKRSIRESINTLKKANKNFLGVILNKRGENKSAGYGRYGRYGRYGKYGRGKYGRYGRYGKYGSYGQYGSKYDK